jgi:hypothetical protein
MGRKTYKAEEIIAHLREVEASQRSGPDTTEALLSPLPTNTDQHHQNDPNPPQATNMREHRVVALRSKK